MKALILAAGMGTRLRPYTNHTPKPLFSVSGRPLLDIIINRLIKAGCEDIMINTHHLHAKIETFISGQNYAIPVQTRYEPIILGTGGAIKNVEDFWNDQPFMVINADIVTTIDLGKIYDFHCRHSSPATLVLTDDPEFNSVVCNDRGFVTGFDPPADALNPFPAPTFTFTGIQVLNPEILEFIPAGVPFSSIDAYARMIAKGRQIRAYISKREYWKDVGTTERYQKAVFEAMAPGAFQKAFSGSKIGPITREHLKGDGSDRQWYRLKMDQRSVILVDHGIRKSGRTAEVDAFVHIGRHLYRRGLPLPEIYSADTFAGFVFQEDLGDLDLQTVVQQTDQSETVIALYQSVINRLIEFSISGAEHFDTAWCYQSAEYDRSLILEKECRYFVEAFLNTYLGFEINYRDFQEEFEFLAANAIRHSVKGLMHRDFQSRNIMIKDRKIYFIDFQGARRGPIQYDLASLLIDPYVDLPQESQARLLEYGLTELIKRMQFNIADFRRCYRFCCLTRNLQILGAFGYLTRVKSKLHFEKYIPAAVRALRNNLKMHEGNKLPGLNALMNKILSHDQMKTDE